MKKMKKLFALLLSIALIVTVTSCTKVGTTDEETTSPESSETAEATTEPSADTQHDPYAIEIYTFVSGTSVSTTGIALADLINENSSWLTATALESQNQNATASLLLGDKAETAIGYVVMPVVENGYDPFTEPNTDLRTICTFGLVCNAFMTLDPAIKTMADLDGKKVMLGPVGGYPRHDIPIAMLDHMGITCDLSYGSFSDSVEALINGQVDVIIGGGAAFTSDMSTWIPSSSYTELYARFDVYNISMDEEALEYAENLYNFHLNPTTLTIPEGTYVGSQEGDVTVMADYLGFCCNKAMPDDVVQEVLRIMADNSEKFVDYLPQGAYITPETMAQVDRPEYIHDAAKAFYEERGLWTD